MTTESNNGESSSRHGCAACKHQRRKCGEDCLLQPYFGLNRIQDFQAAQKVFGISNMNKMMKELELEDRSKAVESLVWEASIWKRDPVNGPLGHYRQLQQENELLKNQVNQLNLQCDNLSKYGVGMGPNYNDVAVNYGENIGMKLQVNGDINVMNFHASNNLQPILQGQEEGMRRNPPIVGTNPLSLERRDSFGYFASPINRVRGRDFSYSNYHHNQLGAQTQEGRLIENNLSYLGLQHPQQLLNPTQQLQGIYSSNCIQGQSSYSNPEIMEDQALELRSPGY